MHAGYTQGRDLEITPKDFANLEQRNIRNVWEHTMTVDKKLKCYQYTTQMKRQRKE